MTARDQFQMSWTHLISSHVAADRMGDFRNWILADTSGFQPDDIFISPTGVSVSFGISDDHTHWWAGVDDAPFSDSTPDRALSIGDTIIDYGRWFAEQRDYRGEMDPPEAEGEVLYGDYLEEYLDDLADAYQDAMARGDKEAAAALKATIDQVKKEIYNEEYPG